MKSLCLILGFTLMGCGGKTSDVKETPPAAAPDAAPAPEEAAAPAVVLRHGALTFVMDSPEGQMSKAEAKLGSLAEALAGVGVEVTFDRDEELDDVVAVMSGEGEELGRIALRDADASEVIDTMVETVKRHFSLE